MRAVALKIHLPALYRASHAGYSITRRIQLNTQGHPSHLRRCTLRAIPLAVLTTLALHGGAQAMEIETSNPDVEVRWDNTVRYNVGQRVEDANASGIGNNPVYDEGEFSFTKGQTVTNRVDLLSEVDFVYKKKFGFRVSGAAWYDDAYSSGKVNRNPALAAVPGSYTNNELSDYTKRFYAGPSGEILDAFVFGSVDVGGAPLTFKAGRHTVFWGESLLLGGALHGVSYSQSPIDLAKGFATPGVDAKELFRPLSSVSGQYQVTNDLSVAAQYFLDWESYRYPEGGTFLGPADFAFNGPQQQFLRPGLIATNGGVLKPKTQGDIALAARWSPEWLDGTMGFYYRNYTDKLMGISLLPGGPTGVQYKQSYAENIDLLGISLGKNIGGISVGTEVSYRSNTPLNAQTLGATPGLANPLLFTSTVALNGNSYQARGNTWHVVMNALAVVPKTALFDTASMIGELTYSALDKVTANQDMFFGEGYGVCRKSLLSTGSATAVSAYKDKADGCSTQESIALAFNFTPTWFQVMPGVDLSMPMAISKTIYGNSPVTLGGNEGNGNYSIGLTADVQQKYRFDLKYVDFFGDVKTGTNAAGQPVVTSQNGLSTLFRDRGHIAFTFKTTF